MKAFAFLLVPVLWASSGAAVDTLAADSLAAWIANGPPESFILIDVRDSSEISSVIGTSSCRPYNMSWNQGVLRAQHSLIPKAYAVVLYCASGHRSGAAAAFLDSLGFLRVHTLANGFGGWNGPTQAVSNLLPMSSLPAYSMVAASAAITARAGPSTLARVAAVSHGFRKNCIVFARGNTRAGQFDAQGALMTIP